MTDLVPTPTGNDPESYLDRDATLTDALDRSAQGSQGMNFHGPRGDLAEVVSYADLALEARETGRRLLSAGLAPGDRVGLVAETEGDFVRAFMGALYARLVPVPLPLPAAFGAKHSYSKQIQRIIEVADARAVVTSDDYVDWMKEPLEGRELLYTGPVADLPAPENDLIGAPVAGDLAYLQFSSGTTGSPKGVAVSHSGLMANLKAMGQDALSMTSCDRGVSWLPFYHDMGLVGCLLLPAAAGMSMDFLATRDFIRRPGLWLSMISRGKATMSYSPSFGYELAARRGQSAKDLDLSSWRIAGIGGDMIRSGNLDEFSRTFADVGFRSESFLPSYGMAELTLGMTFAEVGRGCRIHRLDPEALERGVVKKAEEDVRQARDFAICGKPLLHHEIQIRTREGELLDTSEVGQIHARGPSMMEGYYGDPDATRQVLDGDGWLDTGDVGFLDEDGELVITGRAKDLIIVNGRNIWPQDVEWMVEQGVEGIREGGVVAFGTSSSHETDQEQLTVVIEYRNASQEAIDAIISRTDSFLRNEFQLSPIVARSRPGSLPRTSSGKLSRATARELYLSGAFET